MAACYGPGSPATTFVMLDVNGNMIDYIHCAQLSGMIASIRDAQRVASNLFTDPKKRDDARRLSDFIQEHVPHAIIIGASHPQALVLRDIVKFLVEHLVDVNPRAFTGLESGGVKRWMADERVAALWENSAVGKEELPNAAPIVRRAVALGRHMLDPLSILSSLCGPVGWEALGLNVHPMQSFLSQDTRKAAMVQVMRTAVAQTGVDINGCLRSAWEASSLPFVAGLGPRKAAFLLQQVTSTKGFVENRSQLWTEHGILGNCVFRNAAGFLRIHLPIQNMEADPLDNSRIHPESYEHAVRIAQSATGESEADIAVENSFMRPSEVLTLEIDAYDQHLQEAGEAGDAGTLLSTLLDIQMEFARPYGDMRAPLEPLGESLLFPLACGQTEAMLLAGRRVEAHIRKVTDREAYCTIPELNGVEAVSFDVWYKFENLKQQRGANFFYIIAVVDKRACNFTSN